MVLQWHSVLAMCSGERIKVLEDAWPIPIDCGGTASASRWPEPHEVEVPRAAADVRPVSEADLDTSMDEASNRVKPWEGGCFRLVKRLQEAPGNRGVVDMMSSRLHRGSSVAVKRMPTKWVTFGPADFLSWHPNSPERPWLDLGVMLELNNRGYPYACELLGIYCDQDTTYVVTSLAEDGDLFSWSIRGPKPGPERETLMQPIVLQLFTAVRWLHELGIAHRDLSLENVLLTHQPPGGRMMVRLIDFGMATCARRCRSEVRGKETYQAPEMHTEGEYDAWLADAFQLGSLLFAMAAQDYPWTSTKPGACTLFSSVQSHGFRRFIASKELKRGEGRLASAMSPELARLLEGLLELRPDRRLCLGENQLEGRRSVWDEAWLEVAANASDAGRPWPCPRVSRRLAPL